MFASLAKLGRSRPYDKVWLGRVERQGQDANLLKGGGSEWESNPPSPSVITISGFEDRESHRTPCASLVEL